MKKRVISFMMSAVLTLSGLGCYGLANVHAETDTNVERKLKFLHIMQKQRNRFWIMQSAKFRRNTRM